MDQVSKKYTNIFPNLNFWFENNPSGNPERNLTNPPLSARTKGRK
jgi:hypothetical protein